MITNEIRAYLEDKFNIFHRFLTILSDIRVSSSLMDYYEFNRLIGEKFGEKIYHRENPEYESIYGICLYRLNNRRTGLTLGERWNSPYSIDVIKTCDMTIYNIHDVAINKHITITSHEWDEILKILQPTD